MWRESDKFPTFNPKSYDRMEHNRYWIHDSRTYDGSPSTSKDQYSFPAIRPVYFGSGITIVNNMPFYISGNIIGGDIDNTNDPSISNLFGDLSDRDTELLNPNDSNNPYDISLYIDTNYTNPIADGFWAARITGIIDVDHTIEYSLRVTIQEDANAQFGKTSITYIPVNVLDPISLDIPSTTININYGNKWELNFYVLGGDAPPSYYEDKTEWANNNTPIIEVNGQICNYDIITETYDYDNRKWTYKIRSRNIVTATENFTLSVFDSTGSDSASITVNVGS
jgi:hypothetical protein